MRFLFLIFLLSYNLMGCEKSDEASSAPDIFSESISIPADNSIRSIRTSGYSITLNEVDYSVKYEWVIERDSEFHYCRNDYQEPFDVDSIHKLISELRVCKVTTESPLEDCFRNPIYIEFSEAIDEQYRCRECTPNQEKTIKILGGVVGTCGLEYFTICDEASDYAFTTSITSKYPNLDIPREYSEDRCSTAEDLLP